MSAFGTKQTCSSGDEHPVMGAKRTSTSRASVANLAPGSAVSWSQERSVMKQQFNYPVDTETVEAPSLPRHTPADPAVVNCHGHSERSRRPAARQLHLSGDKLVIASETGFSLLLDGPGILPTRRRTVEQGSFPLG